MFTTEKKRLVKMLRNNVPSLAYLLYSPTSLLITVSYISLSLYCPDFALVALEYVLYCSRFLSGFNLEDLNRSVNLRKLLP